uniref:Zinc transporter ZIP6 n=1 Tax=Callorhinchus milii TaxID=7868 RepID=A0A4W3IUI8_CALMI|eukprot:gi/632965685/ref/XP_007899014.1/ PREDICTED: zinc transporter ZIP6 [Callorhinchus milii]
MTRLHRDLYGRICLSCFLIFYWNGCQGRADHDSDCAVGEHNHDLENGDHILQPDINTANVDRHKAVGEQKYYLHKLFDHYGNNGTLTVKGLEKLLHNMGVGRTRMLKTKREHFDSDHDHLEHELQADVEIHHHCCPEHQHIQLRSGSQTTPKVAPKKKEHYPKQHRDKIHHSLSTTQQSLITAMERSESRKHARPVRSLQSTKSAAVNADWTEMPQDPPATTADGSSSNTYSQTQADSVTLKEMNEDVHGTNGHHKSDKDVPEEECLNAAQLLLTHGMHPQATLTSEQFSYLCPALLDQIDSKVCIIHGNKQIHSENPRPEISVAAVWIGGFVSVTIISFLSLMGIILIPLMNLSFFKFLLTFLVALAVGTLSGDAFLHLLPHSQGIAHHDSHVKIEEDHLNAVWKGLAALGGLYFMFLIEHLITLIKLYKDKKKHKKGVQEDQEVDVDKVSVEECPVSKDEKLNLKPFCHQDDFSTIEANDQPNLHSLDHSQNSLTPEQEVMIVHPHAEGNYNAYVPRGCENKCHSHFHDTIGNADDSHHHHHDYHHILHHHHHQNHHPHSHGHHYFQEDLKDAGIATLAWMVIMGDGLHNFSDGLAIGAAFTGGLSSGLSTSVAVFCHELPHELGDFAVLLKAGMTVKQAVMYNVLSALLGYLGMITGTAIGHYAENVSTWIFAVTAGLFLYVALVDMVPEMLHNDAGDHDCSHGGYFLLQNAGILLGFGIMLVIAIFEHKIFLDIKL